MVERQIEFSVGLSREELNRLYQRLAGVRVVQRCEMLIYEGRDLKAENLSEGYMSSAREQGVEFRVDRFAAVAHTQISNALRKVLAVRLVTDRVFDIEPVGTATLSEASVRCWINAQFLTPQEAANIDVSGRTALAWAREHKGGEVKRVVKAANGYFYACDENDISVELRSIRPVR